MSLLRLLSAMNGERDMFCLKLANKDQLMLMAGVASADANNLQLPPHAEHTLAST